MDNTTAIAPSKYGRIGSTQLNIDAKLPTEPNSANRGTIQHKEEVKANNMPEPKSLLLFDLFMFAP